MKNKATTQNITLKLNNANEMFSPYSEENNLSLKPEIAKHIEHSTEDAKKNSKICVYVETPKPVSEKEKEDCVMAFKNHYKLYLQDEKNELKHYYFISLILLGVGALLTVLFCFLTWWNVNLIVRTLVEIVSWAFVWEFVDVFFFRCMFKRKKLNYIKLLINAKLHFK